MRDSWDGECLILQAWCTAGVLPELAVLGELLEANEEWQQDAKAVRRRMLAILGAVADRYEACGETSYLCTALCQQAPLCHAAGMFVEGTTFWPLAAACC